MTLDLKNSLDGALNLALTLVNMKSEPSNEGTETTEMKTVTMMMDWMVSGVVIASTRDKITKGRAKIDSKRNCHCFRAEYWPSIATVRE